MKTGQPSKRLLFVSSEVYPFSKSGGLGEVAGALPEALAKQGYEVMVVSPWYQNLKHADDITRKSDTVSVPFDDSFCKVGVGVCERNGVKYAFIDHQDFQRPNAYGYEDDAKRFARFCRAVPQVAASLRFTPDIVYANDWQTGYLPTVLQHSQESFLPQGYAGKPTVFLIHNASFQVSAGMDEVMRWLRLPESKRQAMHLEYYGRATPLWTGTGNSARTITVSPNYAREITEPEYNGVKYSYFADKIGGIVNGVNQDAWNPQTDRNLPESCRFSPDDLTGKKAAKELLCEECGFKDTERPLIGVVSRMDDYQKGISVLLKSVDGLVAQGWNVVLNGTGDPALEAEVRRVAQKHPGHVHAEVKFCEQTAHKIFAGSDATVIPSRYEPCGLTQMEAHRYGTVPIARDTGGLHDTIDDGRTGFLFADVSKTDLLAATQRAYDAYHDSSQWKTMMASCMREDHSWEKSAIEYAELNNEILRKSSLSR